MANHTTAPTAPEFGISPERRASISHYFYRQLLINPPPLPSDASFKGKTAIVTGVTSYGGLGIEICRQLLTLGLSTLIIGVRTLEKGEAAKKVLLAEFPSLQSPDSIQVWPLDLASPPSVVAFAHRAKDSKQLPSLDLVMLNAGVFKIFEAYNSTTHYEESIQTNYLSNMLLMLLLIPIIQSKKSDPETNGRICILSSDLAAWSGFNSAPGTPILERFKENPKDGVTKDGWVYTDRYGTSKLLGLLFLSHFCSQVYPFVPDGKGVTIDTANPGFCSGSDLDRETVGAFKVFVKMAHRLVARKCSVGARAVMHAVVGEHDAKWHGSYVEDGKVQPLPPLLYTPEGTEIAARLYDETINELSGYVPGLTEVLKGLKA